MSEARHNYIAEAAMKLFLIILRIVTLTHPILTTINHIIDHYPPSFVQRLSICCSIADEIQKPWRQQEGLQ